MLGRLCERNRLFETKIEISCNTDQNTDVNGTEPIVLTIIVLTCR